jgi:flagellar motility protein MotE (MotC chaperone)
MKKVLLILTPLLLIGGGVVGAHFAGLVKIPGLPAVKKPQAKKPNKDVAEKPVKTASKPKADSAAKPKLTPKTAVKTSTVSVQPERGAKRLAKVWSQMKPGVIAKLTERWNEKDLAQVLAQMDANQVALLLDAIAEPTPRPPLDLPSLPVQASEDQKAEHEARRKKAVEAQENQLRQKDEAKLSRVAAISRALQKQASSVVLKNP